jgi:hypothetical protein
MFNRHPACVSGLGCRVHNFAEPVQIEIKDLVIALPFQVDTQSAWGNVFVYAQDERCILDSFHLCRLSWLFSLQFLSELSWLLLAGSPWITC